MKLYLITEKINSERSKKVFNEEQDIRNLFYKDLEITLTGETAEKRILKKKPEENLILDFYIDIEEVDTEKLTIENTFFIEAGYTKKGHYSKHPGEEYLDINYRDHNNPYKQYRLLDTPREKITKELLINTEELTKNFKLYDLDKMQ